MNIKGMLVNEYTVGGSLLLVGAGFFSTRFTDALSYELFSLPSAIPMIGGASVTVGRVVGLVPLSLGLAFLFGKVKPVTNRIPLVDKVVDIADRVVNEVSMPVSKETTNMGAEFCAEHNAKFAACGCGGCLEQCEECGDAFMENELNQTEENGKVCDHCLDELELSKEEL